MLPETKSIQYVEIAITNILKIQGNLRKTKENYIYQKNLINNKIEELEKKEEEYNNIQNRNEKNNIFYRLFRKNEENDLGKEIKTQKEMLINSKNDLEKTINDIKIKEEETEEILDEVIENYYFSLYIFNKVFDNIQLNNEKIIPKGKFTRFELFAFLFINYLHSGELINGDRLICVDEAQDYNEIEYEIIKKINGKNLRINLYGDINQSFYSKGITSWENLCKNQMFEYYELNENYRNSIQITEFTNKKLNHNVLPMGISGKDVSSIKLEDICGLIQQKQQNGRKFVIILSKEEEKMLFNQIEEVYFSTVGKVKGIEYDTVIVYDKNMSNTEKYISYTRALNELYIIS